MQNKISTNTIERYLRNELSGKELSDFTFQLVMNPSLRQEVEETRLLFKTLQTNGISGGKGGNKTLLLGGIAVLLFSLAAFFVWRNSMVNEPVLPKEKLILPVEKPANVPIAAAFQPNEAIENGLGLRSNDNSRSFSVEFENGTINILGSLRNEFSELKLTIWNNQEEDYIEERFVVARKLKTSATGEINLKLNYPLEKGLYYYEIESAKTIEKLGRFEVR